MRHPRCARSVLRSRLSVSSPPKPPLKRAPVMLFCCLPQLSLAGLEAAKKRLFSQQAPVPIEVITPLQPKEGSTKERPMYFREVSFKVGPNKLAIRQEWVILLADGKPLIGSVSASRVTPKTEKN